MALRMICDLHQQGYNIWMQMFYGDKYITASLYGKVEEIKVIQTW